MLKEYEQKHHREKGSHSIYLATPLLSKCPKRLFQKLAKVLTFTKGHQNNSSFQNHGEHYFQVWKSIRVRHNELLELETKKPSTTNTGALLT